MEEVQKYVEHIKELVQTVSFSDCDLSVIDNNDGFKIMRVFVKVSLEVLITNSIKEHVIDLRNNSQSNKVHDDIHHIVLSSNQPQGNNLSCKCCCELEKSDDHGRPEALKTKQILLCIKLSLSPFIPFLMLDSLLLNRCNDDIVELFHSFRKILLNFRLILFSFVFFFRMLLRLSLFLLLFLFLSLSLFLFILLGSLKSLFLLFIPIFSMVNEVSVHLDSLVNLWLSNNVQQDSTKEAGNENVEVNHGDIASFR